MNQMHATIKVKGEKVQLVAGGLKIPVAEPDRLGLRHGDKATVGIRPDAIELSDGHESRPGYMTFEAEVIVGELMGGTSQLELVSEGQDVVAVIEGHLMPRFGELKNFAVNLEHLYVFDAETQETIY
jgi:ABC-type sugar transport system ATPase subunit